VTTVEVILKLEKCLGLNNQRLSKLFCIGFLLVWVSSCAQPGPRNPSETIDADNAIPTSTIVRTATPIPQTATLLPPTPASTSTFEPPTETLLPSRTPTLTPTPWPTSEVFFDGARVSFINNAGFMITVGDKKILIDALYDTDMANVSPPPAILQRAVKGLPPFDQVDLILATHNHVDHFSAKRVDEFLLNNREAVFVSSPDAVKQIMGGGDDFFERLIPVDLDPGESLHLSIKGIELDCIYLTHGDPSILNIGFVITVDGYTFFHSGDMNVDDTIGDAVSMIDFQEFGLPQMGIDLAFLPSYIFTFDQYKPLVLDGIRARYVSPMHYPYKYPPTGIEDNYSNAVVFRDTLDNWVVPPE